MKPLDEEQLQAVREKYALDFARRTDCDEDVAMEYAYKFADSLTRPPVEFADGEVFADIMESGTEYFKKGEMYQPFCGEVKSRKQSTVESGAGELVALAQWCEVQFNFQGFPDQARRCRKVSNKWKSDRGEE